MENINIFLDDFRIPLDAFSYKRNKIYSTEKWNIVRNYQEFIDLLQKIYNESNWENIKMISFDHDLADEHYAPPEKWNSYDDWEKSMSFKEKTGKHCAEFLVNFCLEHDLNLPQYFVHSMNPIGSKNILDTLADYFKQ